MNPPDPRLHRRITTVPVPGTDPAPGDNAPDPDAPRDDSANDDRLREDKPPHWG